MKPSESGSTMSMQPNPFGEAITGIPSLRASSVSSALASDSVTPWPTKSAGRRAPRIMSSAAVICSGAARRRGGRHLDLVLLLEHVERDIEIHRPGPAREHCGRRLTQRERQHVDAGRLEAALHHGANNVDEIGLIMPIDLLEGAAVELLGRD